MASFSGASSAWKKMTSIAFIASAAARATRARSEPVVQADPGNGEIVAEVDRAAAAHDGHAARKRRGRDRVGELLRLEAHPQDLAAQRPVAVDLVLEAATDRNAGHPRPARRTRPHAISAGEIPHVLNICNGEADGKIGQR